VSLLPTRAVCLPVYLRVRVEIMGSQKCGIVGKSQSVLMMINPMISTRTRTRTSARRKSVHVPSCYGAPRLPRGSADDLRCWGGVSAAALILGMDLRDTRQLDRVWGVISNPGGESVCGRFHLGIGPY
jgi:hypothetical protein